MEYETDWLTDLEADFQCCFSLLFDAAGDLLDLWRGFTPNDCNVCPGLDWLCWLPNISALNCELCEQFRLIKSAQFVADRPHSRRAHLANCLEFSFSAWVFKWDLNLKALRFCGISTLTVVQSDSNEQLANAESIKMAAAALAPGSITARPQRCISAPLTKTNTVSLREMSLANFCLSTHTHSLFCAPSACKHWPD